MKKSRSVLSLLLDLWGVFLIPAYTLLFAGSVEWFSTNFSVLAVAGAGHYRGFLVWGLLAGGYFLVMLTLLTSALPRRNIRRMIYTFGWSGAVCLGLGLPLPYVPEFLPGISQLHVLLAFSACVLVMLALLVLTMALYREDKSYRPFLKGWGAIVAGCGVLFALSGMISTALEVFFTLSVTLFFRRLWRKVWDTEFK